MNRRFFIKQGGLAMAGVGLLAGWPRLLSAALAPPRAARARSKVLVVLFQRGAVDGLSMLVPHGEPAYYDARPNIAIARPGRDEGALDLDGHFGLHPALQPLLPFWRDGQFAAMVATGSPDATRSHFDAQDFMESATPGVKATRDGWLNRLLQHQHGATPSSLSAIAMTAQMPRSLTGPAPALALTDLAEFAVNAGRYGAGVENGLERLWQQRSEGALGDAGRETFEAVQILQRSGAAKRPVENGADYPNGALGSSLRQLAQLIKSDVGLELGFAECGGWDTHVAQGSSAGALANTLRDFGRSIAAFLTDLGPRRDDVLLLTMSEFGRTVRENGSRGTDHGHGNTMLAFGGAVRGGRVLGQWPGLAADRLYEGRDLAVTTDFRSVFAEVVQRHLGLDDPAPVLPGFAIDTGRYLGLLPA